MNMTVDKFIENYIEYIDKEEWEYIYQQAEIHLEYPYDLTSKLLVAGIDPLPSLTIVPYSYAPLEIKEATLSSKCTRIEASAFNGCLELETINLPEGLQVIDSMAFFNSGLKEITLPSTLLVLGPQAFASCNKLEKITYNGTIDQINKVRVWEEVFDNVPAHYIECIDGNIELRDIDE